MNFDNLQDLKSQFTKGKLKSLPDEISVEDIKYKLSDSTSYDFKDVIKDKKKPMVIYILDQKKENKEKYDEKHTSSDDAGSFQSRLVFIWAQTRLNIRPVDVKFVSKSRMGMVMVREANDQNVIGDVVEVRFTSMPQSVTLKGKVDTGALMSSLHADKFEINDKTGNVSFLSKALSPNIISLPLQDKQAIKSADGGTEYRPVIALNLEINGKLLQDVLINLNDRNNMDHKLLIGQNILEKGKFLIDPSIQEGEEVIDWDMLQDEFKDVELSEEVVEISDEHLIEELRIRISNKE
jgi:hypothetical protein